MRDQILGDLHHQFATNQNNHETKFINIFVSILAIFAAYGTIYAMYFNWVNNRYEIKEQAIAGLSIIICIALTYLISITLVAAKVFRRDQFINDKIRKSNLKEEEYKYIFKYYGGTDKNWFSFIPDFLQKRLGFLLFLHIIIFLSVFCLIFKHGPELSLCVSVGFSIISYVLIYCIWRCKFDDYKRLANDNKSCPNVGVSGSDKKTESYKTTNQSESKNQSQKTINQSISLNEGDQATMVSQSITLDK